MRPRPPDPPPDPTVSDLAQHASDVLNAMMLGSYGQRVREFAQAAKDPKKVTPIDPWTALCQALFASAEFRYVN